MSIVFTITDAGRAALVDADHDGTNALTIAEVAFGQGRYSPEKDQTELREPIKRIDTISGQAVADDTLHVTVQDETNDAYSVGEIGLITDAGVLFAVYSQSDWIIEKAAPATLLLANDIVFADIDVSSLTFGDAAFLNPPATETVQGVIEIATQDEVDTGTDRLRAIVPRTLKALLDKVLAAYATVKQLTDHAASRDHPDATTTAKGFVELATYGETRDGTDNTRAVTPAALNARTATTSRTGLVELSTDAEALAGTSDSVVPTARQVRDAYQQYGLGNTSVPNIERGEGISGSQFFYSTEGIGGLGWPIGFNLSRADNNTRDVQLLIQSIGSNPRALIRQRNTDDPAAPFVSAELWHDKNMGAESGLDADKLDGQEGSYYRDASNLNAGTVASDRMFGATTSAKGAIEIATVDESTAGTDSNRAVTPEGLMAAINQYGLGTATPPATTAFDRLLGSTSQFTAGSGNDADGWFQGYGPALVMSRNTLNTVVINGRGNRLAFKGTENSSSEWASSDWNEIFHTGKMGSGSGLDADKLDGQEGSYYRDAGNLNAGTVPYQRLPRTSDSEAEDAGNSTVVMTPRGTARAMAQWGLGAAAAKRCEDLETDSNYFVYSSTSIDGISWPLGFCATRGTDRDVQFLIQSLGSGIRALVRARNTDKDGAPFESAEVWHTGNMGSGSNLDADKLDGQHGSYYRDAGNLNSGTLSASRLSGTYSINISGKAGDSNNLGGQPTSYYRNAGNLNSGTLSTSRLGTGSNERDWVLARTATAAFGAVGTYAMLCNDDGDTADNGELKSGDNLRYASTESPDPANRRPAGTWLCMGYAPGDGLQATRISNWLRVR